MKFISRLIVFILFSAPFVFNSSLSAQYYFGRNKIQYDDFDWKILKTEHFDVYFYPEMRELAEIGAAFAEEAYSRLESKVNHNVNRRIPLIFYSNHSHFQQTNTVPSFLPEGTGGFFWVYKGASRHSFTGFDSLFQACYQSWAGTRLHSRENGPGFKRPPQNHL